MPLKRQSDTPGFSLYRENAMLIMGKVLFVTIHIPGSNNNLEYRLTQGNPNPFYDGDKEYTARNAANLAWLKSVFATAKEQDLYGVMILTQANMFEAFGDNSTGASKSGFADFIKALREEIRAFPGQVVMVSGDTHYMRVDKPLTLTYPDSCPPPATSTGSCPAVESIGVTGAVPADVRHVSCQKRPDLDAADPFGRTCERIASKIHRRGPGVVCVSFKVDFETALPRNGLDHAQREIEAVEHRSLLDVELEIAARRRQPLRQATASTTNGSPRDFSPAASPFPCSSVWLSEFLQSRGRISGATPEAWS